ncbi:MAG: hypothetical protein ABII01_00250 [Candidatus Woesearchaeota archaeon]
MDKRGQVTVFIIIAVIILVVVGALLYYTQIVAKDRNLLDIFMTPQEKVKIGEYMTACFQNNLKDLVTVATLQGGYLGIPDNRFEYNLVGINYSFEFSYYLKDGLNKMPSLDFIGQEIKNGFIPKLYKCTNLSILNLDADVQAEFFLLELDISINENSVNANFDLPIEVVVGDTTYYFDEFKVEVPSNLKKLYDISSEITEKQVELRNEVCITCIPELMDRYGIEIETNEFVNDERYIIIYSLIKDNEMYSFVHEFTSSEQDDQGPIIERIYSLNATIGYEFEYKVDARGDDIRYYDNTDLFDIDSFDGTIKFTPFFKDAGDHIIRLKVVDKQGKIAQETFTMHIAHLGLDPYITPIGPKFATVGNKFTFQVEATGRSDLTYLDNSSLFDINDSGLIDFTPIASGNQDILITVIDNTGHYSTEEFTLIIGE